MQIKISFFSSFLSLLLSTFLIKKIQSQIPDIDLNRIDLKCADAPIYIGEKRTCIKGDLKILSAKIDISIYGCQEGYSCGLTPSSLEDFTNLNSIFCSRRKDLAPGQKCGLNSDCASNKCQDHVCVSTLSKGDSCSSTKECPTGTWCKRSTCQDIGKTGDTCSSDMDCKHGLVCTTTNIEDGKCGEPFSVAAGNTSTYGVDVKMEEITEISFSIYCQSGLQYNVKLNNGEIFKSFCVDTYIIYNGCRDDTAEKAQCVYAINDGTGERYKYTDCIYKLVGGRSCPYPESNDTDFVQYREDVKRLLKSYENDTTTHTGIKEDLLYSNEELYRRTAYYLWYPHLANDKVNQCIADVFKRTYTDK